MAQKTEVEEKLSYKYERWEYLNQLAEELKILRNKKTRPNGRAFLCSEECCK